MAEYLCCKCYCEFDDSEEDVCPVCDFPVCHGNCGECHERGQEARYQMAKIMTEENPFIQVSDAKKKEDRSSRVKEEE